MSYYKELSQLEFTQGKSLRKKFDVDEFAS